jgi:hypothetical protein
VTEDPDATARSWLRTLGSRRLGLEPSLDGAAVGWATVDLERAMAELAERLAGHPTFIAAADDVLMGARCRVAHPAAPLAWVVLEPTTEGRLAAFLARHGEGLAVGWLSLAAPNPALTLLPSTPTALGAGRLVHGGDRFGPHLVILEPGWWPRYNTPATIDP